MKTFNLKIDGENVSPETVDLGDLLDMLTNVRKAIIAAAVDAGQPRQGVFLSLQKVEKKCNLLTVCENEEAHVGRVKVENAIRLRDLSHVPTVSQQALRYLWRKAIKHSWSITFQDKTREAMIDPLKGMPRERLVRGNTSIYAYVLRAGGADPTVSVRLPNQEIRTFSVKDQSIAKHLGEKLYQHVVLHGAARWFRGSQKLAHFKVMHVGNFNDKTANPAETMAALSRMMGHRWTGVDADAYLREERSEEE